MERGTAVYVLTYFSPEDGDACILGVFRSEDEARTAAELMSSHEEETLTPWEHTNHNSLECQIENDDLDPGDWASYWIKSVEFGLLPNSYRSLDTRDGGESC